ncbi:MAG TPA: Hsp20/alpha crystallin family protein [Solirubrobacteraceae bacterium]|jgi:HSP20 family protein
MALIRWQSGRELDSIQSDINRLFGTFFDSHTAQERAQRRWVPAVDLVEEDDRYVLSADVPGVDEKDVTVEVKDNVLSISGERTSEHEESRDGYARVERASGSFRRTLRLPEGTDPAAIEASIEQGVLEVSIPKPAQAGPHKVAIKAPAGESA